MRGRIGPIAAAVGVAMLAAGLAATLSRQESRGGGSPLLSGPEIWLTAVFVAAVLVLLFGASTWLGVAFRGRGAREALEHLRARADDMDRRSESGGGGGGAGGREGGPGGRVGDVGGGTLNDGPGQGAGTSPARIMEVGGWLALLYVAGWLALG